MSYVKWVVIILGDQVAIALTIAAYLGGAVYGLTQLKEGLRTKDLVRFDSHVWRYLDQEEQFFDRAPIYVQVLSPEAPIMIIPTTSLNARNKEPKRNFDQVFYAEIQFIVELFNPLC